MPAMSGNAGAFQDLAGAREEARRIGDVQLPAIQQNMAAVPPAQQNAKDVAAAERLMLLQQKKKKGIPHSINPLGGPAAPL